MNYIIFLLRIGLFFILQVYTCKGKVECPNETKIAILFDSQKRICGTTANDYFSISNEKNILSSEHSNSKKIVNVGVFYHDNCEENNGIMRAILEAIMWAKIECLKPWLFLGFVGPNEYNSITEVLKVTSNLQTPHITSFPLVSPQIHFIQSKDGQLIAQILLELLELFNWKVFKLEINRSFYLPWSIGNEIIKASLEKNFCLQSSTENSTNILQLGAPGQDFFSKYYNSNIILFSHENHEKDIKVSRSTNSFLLMENLRFREKNFFEIGENTNITSEWNKFGKIGPGKEQEFMNTAMEVLLQAKENICKKNCTMFKDYHEWNKYLSKFLKNNKFSEKKENIETFYFKIFSIRDSNNKLGKIVVNDRGIKVFWNNKILNPDFFTDKIDSENLRNFYFADEYQRFNCKQDFLKIEFETKNHTDIIKNKNFQIDFSLFGNTEWWTMICSVAGVCITMFFVGAFAVYIIYSNIRGSKNSSPRENYHSSLRRMGSNRFRLPSTENKTKSFNSFDRDGSESARSNIS